MKILDLTAGNRAVWFEKNHPLAIGGVPVSLTKLRSFNPTTVENGEEA